MVSVEAGVDRLPAALFKTKPHMDINIRNSQQKAELFHFKVMQLSVHEDHPDRKSECSVRFQFVFDIIRKKERDYLKDFDWDVCSTPEQRLYLSKDTTKMMEVINNFIATVYYRVNIDDDG